MERHSRSFRVAIVLSLSPTLAPGLLVAQAVTPPPAASETPPPKKLEPFVVTGSYIPSTETAIEAGASPVTRIDRKEIDASGATTTAELLQKITVSNANAVPISNNATGFTPGATSISLRGLGPDATLVLINGRRVANYPVGAGGTTAFVDLNSIPLSAVDNIEVLKDGASALYGADAVAGVINIKLRRSMTGTDAFVSYGNTTRKDSSETVASLATGVSTGRMSLIVGLNFYNRQAILNRDRAYSAVPPFLSTNSSPANLEVGRFAVSAALSQPVNAAIPGVPAFAGSFFAQSGAEAGNLGTKPASQYTYSPDRSATFNFNEFAMSYPASRRAGAFVSGERKVFGTDHVKVYGDLSYQNVAVDYELAPAATGDFSTPGQVELIIPARTANPILTVYDSLFGSIFQVAAGTAVPARIFPGPGTKIVRGVVQRLAAPGAFNPFNPFNQDLADGSRLRLAEFGNRILRNQTEAALFTAGLKAERIAGKWNYDASFSFSSIRDRTRNTMNSASRFNEIVNAASPLFDPRSGSYLGTGVPYNPFGYYRNPPAGNARVVEYGRVTVRDDHRSTLGQVNVVGSTAELFRLASRPVGLAFGGDFRREQLGQRPDALGVAGDIIGESPRATTTAQRKIGGAFLEVRVPLVNRLEASASVRHEKFFTSGRETTVPKLALRWQPIAGQLTLRTSLSEGFREPSLYELYSTPTSALLPIQDPRDGFIEPEQPITLRGNRRLNAEETDYFNAGFVWSPTIVKLKGLSLGADFWRVTRTGTVEANPQHTVNRAFGATPGGLLPGESVILTSSGFISVVNSVFFNVGRTVVEGWDFSGGYQLPTDSLGRWELTSVWTLVTRFDRSAVQGVPLRSVLGLDSTGSGDNGYLKLKGRVNVSWAYKGFNVRVAGTYTDGFQDIDLAGRPFQVADSLVCDGQVAYSFRGNHGRLLRDARVSVGVQNLFDRDPPKAFGSGGNATGYPSHLYTSENRFWYVALSRKF